MPQHSGLTNASRLEEDGQATLFARLVQPIKTLDHLLEVPGGTCAVEELLHLGDGLREDIARCTRASVVAKGYWQLLNAPAQLLSLLNLLTLLLGAKFQVRRNQALLQ